MHIVFLAIKINAYIKRTTYVFCAHARTRCIRLYRGRSRDVCPERSHLFPFSGKEPA